nr:unnamed protein product [Callosobruchus chinensis]
MNKHLRTLKVLNLPIEHWDALIIYYMMSGKLDRNSSKEWERLKVSGDNIPNLDDFKKFLIDKADFLATFENIQKDRHFKKITKNVSLLSKNQSKQGKQCNFCNIPEHTIYTCQKFLELDLNSRWEEVIKLKLCSNCLCKGHSNKNCRLRPCRICKKWHSSILHRTNDAQREQSWSNVSSECSDSTTNVAPSTSGNRGSQDIAVILSGQQKDHFVLLSIAIVKISDSKGKNIYARVILDSGSQSCYVTDDLCRKLKLERNRVDISVLGSNNLSTTINLF